MAPLRLLAAGYMVTGHDRARTHEVALQRFGAAIAASPRELAGAVDVVPSSVADDAVEELDEDFSAVVRAMEESALPEKGQ